MHSRLQDSDTVMNIKEHRLNVFLPLYFHQKTYLQHSIRLKRQKQAQSSKPQQSALHVNLRI